MKIGESGPLNVSLTVGIGKCSATVTEVGERPDSTNDFSIPNVFTPNSDGVNDCFQIDAPSAQGCFSLAVYNRWGRQVFTTENPDDCWDGGELASGTYFYVLEIFGESHRGHLSLFR